MMNKRFLLKFFDGFLRIFILVHKRKIDNFHKTDKILAIKLSAMGDAICMMPSLRLLRSKYPNSRIDWLTTKRTNYSIFKGIPFIDKIIVMPTNISMAIYF